VWDRPDSIAASPADRARAALLDDWTRSNREIALAVRSTTAQVASVRRALTGYGVLPVTTPQRRAFPSPAPLPRSPRSLQTGSCVGHPRPDLWISPASPAEREEAKHICRFCCPVTLTCRDWALKAVPAADTAIYGGCTAPERARLRQQMGLGRLPGPSGRPAIEAALTTCPECGLPLQGPNLVTEVRRDGSAHRRCRACTRARKTASMRAYRARRKAAAQAAQAQATGAETA
jgi:hypothetical protein